MVRSGLSSLTQPVLLKWVPVPPCSKDSPHTHPATFRFGHARTQSQNRIRTATRASRSSIHPAGETRTDTAARGNSTIETSECACLSVSHCWEQAGEACSLTVLTWERWGDATPQPERSRTGRRARAAFGSAHTSFNEHGEPHSLHQRVQTVSTTSITVRRAVCTCSR